MGYVVLGVFFAVGFVIWLGGAVGVVIVFGIALVAIFAFIEGAANERQYNEDMGRDVRDSE